MHVSSTENRGCGEMAIRHVSSGVVVADQSAPYILRAQSLHSTMSQVSLGRQHAGVIIAKKEAVAHIMAIKRTRPTTSEYLDSRLGLL